MSNSQIKFNIQLKELAALYIKQEASQFLNQQRFTSKDKTFYFHAITDNLENDTYYLTLNKFMELTNPKLQSRNPLNKKDLITGYKILDSGFENANNIAGIFDLHPERIHIGDNYNLIQKYSILMQITGFKEEYPIVFDKEWRILDGYQRFLACFHTRTNYEWIKIDY
jgi:hypothetical protein